MNALWPDKLFALNSEAVGEMSQRIVTHAILLTNRVGFENRAPATKSKPLRPTGPTHRPLIAAGCVFFRAFSALRANMASTRVPAISPWSSSPDWGSGRGAWNKSDVLRFSTGVAR